MKAKTILTLAVVILAGCSTATRTLRPVGSVAQAGTGVESQSIVKPAPTPPEYALGLLKRSADRLSAASDFSFTARSSVEALSPAGHVLNYFSTSEVAVQRPNKLMLKKTGEGPAFDLYCDGQTFGAVDAKAALYAEMPAPGTLDELIPAVEKRTGIQFPFADMLHSDVFRALTNGLTHAYWVGKATVDGVECDHLAFASAGAEWQVWLGPERDPLPRRLAVTYLNQERQPRLLVSFSQWNLRAKLPASCFVFRKPAGAQSIEFRPISKETR